MPRRSLSSFKGRAPLLDVQTKNGAMESYSGQFTGNYLPLQDRTGAGALGMELFYTPPVDAWWEVTGFIGYVVKIDAAYHYMVGGLSLTPADVDGVSGAHHLVTQHSQVQTYEGRMATRLFKLAASTAYKVQLGLFNSSGGTWQYYCGPNQLYLNGKAWTR